MVSPAVSTAPAFATAPNERLITLHMIDASGDLFTQPFPVAIGATNATLQTMKDAYQAATQSSIWATTDQLMRFGDADPDNADTLMRFQGESGINMLLKNPTTLQSFTPRLIAPVPATMQGNSDTPLLSSTEMTNLILAILAIETGYNLAQAQYTTRRERKNNTRVK